MPVLTNWEKMLGATESPIEQSFLSAFCELATENGYRVWRNLSGNETIAVRPQAMIGPHRVDFSVGFRFFESEIALIIECDGHDFHERTVAQARKDKSRDRKLTAFGYRPLRFTGSEIFQNARACALEALSIIMDFQTATVERAASK